MKEFNEGGRIKSLLKIFNKYKNLMGGGRINFLLKIFNEYKFLTGWEI